jgi:hypothetical protein
VKARQEEDGRRIMPGENAEVHGCAADDQFSVSWSLDLNWTPLGIHVPWYVRLYV